MKKIIFISALSLFLAIMLTGCSVEPPAPTNNQPGNQANTGSPEHKTTWRTYENQKLGFSLNVPDSVMTDPEDPASLATLNIFETKDWVYFTTNPLDETLKNFSWNFRIGGTKINKESEIVPFIESAYGVKGCKMDSQKDPETGLTYIFIDSKLQNLSPDDPLACWIGGKLRVLLDDKSGRLITYTTTERFFQQPNGYADEDAMASFKFPLAASSTTSATENISWASGIDGKYFLTNLSTGASEKFLPEGYEIISQHEYENLPEFLILKKGSQLFSYGVMDKKIKAIFNASGMLRKNELARVHPSITEKNKFFIVITAHNLSVVNEMDGSSPIVGTRSYFYDASSGALTAAGEVNPDSRQTCFQYDSKNQRFFGWPCGEGIGSALPLSILDLKGLKQSDIMSAKDFGLPEDSLGLADLHYYDGKFIASDNGNAIGKLITLDTAAAKPQQNTYVLSEAIKDQLRSENNYSAYSIALDKTSKTLIIGTGYSMDLFSFDDKGNINKRKSFPEKELYANFVFINGGKLYYMTRAAKAIRVINLSTWQIEKTLPAPADEEVTIIGQIK